MNVLGRVHSRYGGTRYRTYVMIPCPYHDDNRPSMQVHADFAYCLACEKKVPTKQLLQTNIILAKKRRIENFKFSNPFSLWKSKGETLAQSLKIAYDYNSTRPSFYLKRRGIEPDQQRRFRLGWRDNWITIPFRGKDGKIIGATARAGDTNKSQAKYVNPYGQSPDLFYIPDWSLFPRASKVFLTFGILDAVSISVLGKPAMSTTTGKSGNSNVLKWCRSDIIVIPDFGEEEEAYRLARSLGLRGKVLLPDYPIGSKDINDMFVNHREALYDIIR